MFNQYQKESTDVFKPIKPLQPQQIRLLDWAMGLGGEAGEVLDLLKHIICHQDTQLDKMELAKELGDVLWYVSAIATTCEIDLADVAALNRAKLLHRYQGAYSVEASANRHDAERALKDTPLYRCLEARINNNHNAPVNVIVIGPDGSGKTTLTKKLAEITSMKYIKCDYRQEDKPELAKKLLNDAVDVIYDRFYFPDELIYSAVKNIELDPLYEQQLCSIYNTLQHLNPIFIYVDASLDVLAQRSVSWQDDYVSVEELQAIKGAYKDFLDSLAASTEVPIIMLDTTDIKQNTPAYDDMLRYVIKRIDECRIMYGTPNILKEEGKVNESN